VRAEDIAPRTWLLAALAGWALLAWILALAGMGGRVAPLADDPTLLQPLPAVRASSPQRLGPLAQYGEIAARPLFTDDRRPKPFSLRADEGEQANTFDYILTSVLITPALKLAILQPTAEAQAGAAAQGEAGGGPIRVKLGESAEQASSWRLVALEPRSAVFAGPEGERTLELRAFDGTGGTPATPASVPRAGGTGAPPGVAGPVPGAIANPSAQRPPRPVAGPVAAPVPQPSAPPPPQDAAGNAVTTPDAQIEAIRQRIQARREQLRREAQAPQPVSE
jgi:general secretion pathway protein N